MLHILVWVGSPALALAGGSIFESHPGIEEIAVNRTIISVIDAVEADTMTDISEADLARFTGFHVSVPVNVDTSHSHSSVDGCCGLGGLVCDASIVATYSSVILIPQKIKIEWSDTNPFSVDVPTLRHPPKTQA